VRRNGKTSLIRHRALETPFFPEVPTTFVRAMRRFGSGVRRAKAAPSVSPFDKPKKDRVGVKVINHLDDQAMKVFRA